MAMAIPMESNPETMTKYLSKLGVSNNWRIVDVIGLDQDALALIPRPVLAVILLFPISDMYEKHRIEEETMLTSKSEKAPQAVFHLQQVRSNVCGVIALVHSVVNNTHQIYLEDGLIKKYLKDAEDLDAAAKGELLENTAAIFEAYKDIVQQGITEGDDNNESVNNHFVTFIHKDGTLFELDGRKSIPINHGPTTPENLLEDAAKICRQFMNREPNNIGFTVVALVPAP